MGRVIRAQRRSHAIVRLAFASNFRYLKKELIHKPSSNPTPTTTNNPPVCATLISQSATVTFVVSLRRSSTMPVGAFYFLDLLRFFRLDHSQIIASHKITAVPPSPVSSSVTHTATSCARRPSSPPKACTPAHSSTAAKKLP